MSNFQLDQERGKAIKIEMPPLPEEHKMEASLPEQPEPIIQELIEQTEPEVIEAAPETEPELKQSPKEVNFANLRKAKEQAERERDEAIRLLRERFQAEQPKVQAQEQPESDDLGIGADDIAEGKHVSKVDKKYEKRYRELKQELDQYKQQATQTSIETRLRSQYPDFEKVVSRENIEVFREMHPELAASINASPDLYNKAVSAYQLIKKLGIHPEEPYIADKERATKNAAKPRPLTSISPQQGDSPLSKANAFANGLTKDLKAQLLKEMNDAKANY